jgi:hypothetical protein
MDNIMNKYSFKIFVVLTTLWIFYSLIRITPPEMILSGDIFPVFQVIVLGSLPYLILLRIYYKSKNNLPLILTTILLLITRCYAIFGYERGIIENANLSGIAFIFSFPFEIFILIPLGAGIGFLILFIKKKLIKSTIYP